MDPEWRPSKEFFVSLRETETQLRTLFSAQAWTTFREVKKMLTADGALGLPGDRKTDEQFTQAHDRAMRVMYGEIGLRLP